MSGPKSFEISKHMVYEVIGGRGPTGKYFFSFNPAISDDAAKRIRAQIRSWRLHLRRGSSLKDLAREINMVVRGWINYYGRFYPSALVPSLNRINDYLVRWIVQNTSGTAADGCERETL